MVYCPKAHVIFPIPFGALTNAYDPAAFQGTSHSIKARVATTEEITAYRNVALNSLDQRNVAKYFPHATASSATRNDPIFFERNAIDGNVRNQHHGKWPYESWGNDRSMEPWIKIDFGREVAIDKVRLYLRCDFPHDTCWTNATIQFSDGSSQDVHSGKDARSTRVHLPHQEGQLDPSDEPQTPRQRATRFRSADGNGSIRQGRGSASALDSVYGDTPASFQPTMALSAGMPRGRDASVCARGASFFFAEPAKQFGHDGVGP